MFIDVAKYTGSDVTQSATVLYLKLTVANTPVSHFTQNKQNGDAPFGGVTGGHFVFRERFGVLYGVVPDYQWANCQFVKTTDTSWVMRLQHDQNLLSAYAFKGSDRTASFGTSGGQYSLLNTLISSVYVYQHTLCNQADVERLLLSNLQGRLSFVETIPAGDVGPHVMTYDNLWRLIYEQSGRFQTTLGKYYSTPLRLGDESERGAIALACSKAVALELFRRYLPQQGGWAQGALPVFQAWENEVKEFLTQPPDLQGEVRQGQGGGSMRVERG